MLIRMSITNEHHSGTGVMLISDARSDLISDAHANSDAHSNDVHSNSDAHSNEDH